MQALTRVLCMHYYACMNDPSTYQITLRGLRKNEKDAVVATAKRSGLSLNKYGVKALLSSSIESYEEIRLAEMKDFLKHHPVFKSKEEIKEFQEALAWSKRTSIEKQQREERDINS
jgi:hypothetical protein